MNRRTFIATVAGIVTSAVALAVSGDPVRVITYPMFTSTNDWLYLDRRPRTMIVHPDMLAQVKKIMKEHR